MKLFIPLVCNFFMVLILNSCSEPVIDIDELENVFTHSKTLSLTDDTGANSLDLLIRANSQHLLDKYTKATVSLEVGFLQTASKLSEKSALVSNDTLEEPASEYYINFVVSNEVFGDNVANYNIDIIFEKYQSSIQT